MSSPYAAQIRQKAQAFIDQLQAQRAITATIDEDSWREYHVKLRTDAHGTFNLYYSPKKQSFKLVAQGKTPPDVIDLWQTLEDDPPPAPKPVTPPKTPYQAYVDGSYNAHTRTIGYGAVILHEGEEVTRLSGRVTTHTKSRQIGGELTATMRVVDYCQAHDIDAIDIYYDYKGIEQWARGKWKANSPVAREYVAYMRDVDLTIHWHKVESHTGVKWNDVADELAKQGTQA